MAMGYHFARTFWEKVQQGEEKEEVSDEADLGDGVGSSAEVAELSQVERDALAAGGGQARLGPLLELLLHISRVGNALHGLENNLRSNI
jgi:hypothetical protein